MIGGVSFVDKLMFTKHLSVMIKAGVPLSDAFDTLAENSKSKKLGQILRKVLKDIQSGKSIHESISKYPAVFDTFYVNMIKVSEESGTLDENLEFLSKQLAKDYALRKKIQGAMFYPILVLVAGSGIGLFISLFVLPQLVDFFETLDVDLPASTRVLLYFANLMKDHGILIIASLITGFIGLVLLTRVSFVKPHWHKLKIKAPLLGKLSQYGQLARFSRNLGTMLKSGVPIQVGLETSASTLSNIVFQRHFMSVQKDLSKGKSIGDALEKRKYKEIPQVVIKMITVGEKTGNLEEVLLYLSEFYEEEIDNMTKSLTTILEPLMLAVIGIGVGFIALAIISPIYELTSSVNVR